ncbi:MAG: hypothetical protein LKE37_08870 [Atopobiaceae bacterium]|jgi:hypothetical protein|nr:hypothetical protein [Atopobiaceae bacterium]
MDKQEKITELLSKPDLVRRLSECADAGAVKSLAAENGLELTDAEAAAALDALGEGELQRGELDAVSGGTRHPTLPNC